MSQLLIAQNALQAFIQHPATDIHTPPATDMDALATKNVDDILQYYMNQAEALVGKPMSLMNKSPGLPGPEGRIQDLKDQRSPLRDASDLQVHSV